MKICNSYNISRETLAIIPILSNFSRIYDGNEFYVVKLKSTLLMNNCCKFFGSSLIERQKISKRLLNSCSKLPIIVEESANIIFFPTNSSRNDECIWISYNNLEKYFKENSKRTRLVFKNGISVTIQVSYNIIDNQYARCLKLEKEVENRRKSL